MTDLRIAVDQDLYKADDRAAVLGKILEDERVRKVAASTGLSAARAGFADLMIGNNWRILGGTLARYIKAPVGQELDDFESDYVPEDPDDSQDGRMFSKESVAKRVENATRIVYLDANGNSLGLTPLLSQSGLSAGFQVLYKKDLLATSVPTINTLMVSGCGNILEDYLSQAGRLLLLQSGLEKSRAEYDAARPGDNIGIWVYGGWYKAIVQEDGGLKVITRDRSGQYPDRAHYIRPTSSIQRLETDYYAAAQKIVNPKDEFREGLLVQTPEDLKFMMGVVEDTLEIQGDKRNEVEGEIVCEPLENNGFIDMESSRAPGDVGVWANAEFANDLEQNPDSAVSKRVRALLEKFKDVVASI